MLSRRARAQVVGDYCRLMRQTARGSYNDRLLASRAELRLYGECQLIFKELKHAVVATQPSFADPAFNTSLTSEMLAFRGRELPGFTNSQVFHGFMAQNVESWRPAVDACRNRYIQAAHTVSRALIDTLAPAYPALCNAIRNITVARIEALADAVVSKLDDVFTKEADPYTTNESMVELIDQIRARNFEIALNSSLGAAGQRGSLDEIKAHTKASLGDWYIKTHGVNTTSKVEDMCTILQAYWSVATKRLVDNVRATHETHAAARARERGTSAPEAWPSSRAPFALLRCA